MHPCRWRCIHFLHWSTTCWPKQLFSSQCKLSQTEEQRRSRWSNGRADIFLALQHKNECIERLFASQIYCRYAAKTIVTSDAAHAQRPPAFAMRLWRPNIVWRTPTRCLIYCIPRQRRIPIAPDRGNLWYYSSNLSQKLTSWVCTCPLLSPIEAAFR